jgi:protein-S-isoprenylcysteine O-methyltransferase Ste14
MRMSRECGGPKTHWARQQGFRCNRTAAGPHRTLRSSRQLPGPRTRHRSQNSCDNSLASVAPAQRAVGKPALKFLQGLLSEVTRRGFADILLFAFTLAELVALVLLTPTFAVVDWIYVLQHLVVLGLAFTRRSPAAQDSSIFTFLAVVISCLYPYAQVIYLHWTIGHVVWIGGGVVLVALSAFLSLASLLSLGRFFGFRPALRGLTTKGPYRLVRHPMYMSYLLSDIGYNLHEWNVGTALIVLAGWASLTYRILAEERMLSQDADWQAYVGSVRWRLVPGVW